MTDTIRQDIIGMGEDISYSSAQERKLSLQHRQETPCMSGESLRMIQDRSESTVPSSAMSPAYSHLTLSERLTPSLISAGLVKGITLTYAKRLLNHGIPVTAIYAPDGSVVDIPRQDYISWKD